MKAAKQTIEATWIEIPFDVEAVFGSKGIPVKATVNGTVYRGSIVRMGGEYMLGIPKAFQEAAMIQAGDDIVVTLEADIVEGTVDVPTDLARELKKYPKLKTSWDALSYTIRKENARALEGAKQPETRTRCLEKTLRAK